MTNEVMEFKWKVARSAMSGTEYYQVWRQIRELRPNEPMHCGVRENAKDGAFLTRIEAETYAELLNSQN